MAENEVVATEAPATTEAAPEATAVQPTGGTEDRAALIAAAEAAGGAEQPKTEAAKPEAAATEPAESKIGAILRAREKATELREAGKSEAESLIATAKATAQEEANKIIAAARAAAESEAAAWKAKFRTAPLQAIKDQGIDTRTLVDEVQREGSPEWQAQKRLEAGQEATRAELAELKAWREEQIKFAKTQQEQYQAHSRRQTETQFVGLFPEGSAARTLYEEAELVAKGHSVADAYYERTKQVASIEDVRDYLEEQAVKRLAAIRNPQSGQTFVPASTAPAAAAKPANQPKANGPRALSAGSGAERRASPKPFHELSEAEQRAAQIAAADAAMK